MTDKTMPTNIWAMNYEADMGHGEWDDYQPFQPNMATEYTLVHNNPEYHVVPKSDVDEDVMGAFEHLVDCLDGCMAEHELNLIRNALIAQSDPDIVRIPRMLAESALECMQAYDSVEWNDGCEGDNYSESIYELEKVLNYKEGV